MVNVLKFSILYSILFWPDFWGFFLHLFLKMLGGMANIVDPDETASSGAV